MLVEVSNATDVFKHLTCRNSTFVRIPIRLIYYYILSSSCCTSEAVSDWKDGHAMNEKGLDIKSIINTDTSYYKNMG